MSKLLLEANSLSKSYDYELFKDISIKLHSRDLIAVMGRSGSGKSTLLHILSTLLKPDNGNVEIFGRDIYSLKSSQIEQIRRNDIGIIFQSHYLFKGMSVRDNIEAATLLANEKFDKTILEMLEIDDIIDKNVSDISGGQQQRVSIARVLSKKPKIIFADEPTGNLDKESANLVIDVLKNYIAKENGALFVVTHDIDIAKQLDIVYKLENKKLVVI